MLSSPTLTTAVQVTLSGMVAGSIFALILLGVLLVYRTSGAVNFAHGALGMIAAFFSYRLYNNGLLAAPLAMVVGIATSILIAMGIDRGLMQRVRRDRPGFDLVITLGVMLLLSATAQLWFGPNSYRYLSLGNDRPLPLTGVFLNVSDLAAVAVLVCSLGLLALISVKTSAGVSIRAVAADPVMAQTVGLNVSLIRTVIWAVSGGLAAIAGVLIASRITVNAFYMTPFLIKAFVAGIVGGLDRLVRPLALAVGLGIYEAWVVFALGADARIPAVFLSIVLFLSLAPRRFLEEQGSVRP